MLRLNFVPYLTDLHSLFTRFRKCLFSERYLCLIFFMSLCEIRQIYFHGLRQGLKEAPEAFLFGLALEILPCLSSEKDRKCVLTPVGRHRR